MLKGEESVEFQFKEKYDINDLVEIVRILRSPEGCPWDKVQTHETIRQDFIEEVYEAVEAIDEKDAEHLKEELGDVLLNVVFHAVLEEEQGRFDFNDTADDVCKKMIFRHPHVFGNTKADTPEEVLANWDKIKMKSKEQKSVTETMESVSKSLPSLIRAQKLHKKAERGGLLPKSAEEMIDDISAGLARLKESLAENSADDNSERIGDILFEMTGLAKALDTESEKSLYNACGRFIERFDKLEKNVGKAGIKIQNVSPDVVRILWENKK